MIDPNLPVALSTDELIEALEDVIAHLREHDSFGGFLEYDALTEVPEGKDFMVRAGYRIGNSEGQGGMRFVCGEGT